MLLMGGIHRDIARMNLFYGRSCFWIWSFSLVCDSSSPCWIVFFEGCFDRLIFEEEMSFLQSRCRVEACLFERVICKSRFALH